MRKPQVFEIVKMDKKRGNIVVSRRQHLQKSFDETRDQELSKYKEGQIIDDAVVKALTPWGAFIMIGNVETLCHINEISHSRINAPSDLLRVSQKLRVKIIKIDQETKKVSTSIKALTEDPYSNIEKKYKEGKKCSGKVSKITDYGAFVELEIGIEGLVHVSEMSWTKKNVHPGKIVSTSQEVEVMVLDVDPSKRRISLGLKQCIPNPWTEFTEKFKAGNEVEGEIKNITEFGLFVGLTEEIDGMVHLSDLDWVKPGEEVIGNYVKGGTLKVKILEVDAQKERISLGIKQLIDDPVSGSLNKIKKGDIVTCTITKIVDNGIEVSVLDDIPGFIRRGDLSRDRSEQRPDRFAAGEVVDAKVSNIDLSLIHI